MSWNSEEFWSTYVYVLASWTHASTILWSSFLKQEVFYVRPSAGYGALGKYKNTPKDKNVSLFLRETFFICWINSSEFLIERLSRCIGIIISNKCTVFHNHYKKMCSHVRNKYLESVFRKIFMKMFCLFLRKKSRPGFFLYLGLLVLHPVEVFRCHRMTRRLIVSLDAILNWSSCQI